MNVLLQQIISQNVSKNAKQKRHELLIFSVSSALLIDISQSILLQHIFWWHMKYI